MAALGAAAAAAVVALEDGVRVDRVFDVPVDAALDVDAALGVDAPFDVEAGFEVDEALEIDALLAAADEGSAAFVDPDGVRRPRVDRGGEDSATGEVSGTAVADAVGAFDGSAVIEPAGSGSTIGGPDGTGGPTGRGRRIGGSSSDRASEATSEARLIPPPVSSDAPEVETALAPVVGGGGGGGGGREGSALWSGIPTVLPVAGRIDSSRSAGAAMGASGRTAGEAGGASGEASSAARTSAALGFFALQL